jgi:hypothetical protein
VKLRKQKVDLLRECFLSASVGRVRWVNFLIHNYFTHLGGCALLWNFFCFCFPMMAGFYTVLSTLDLKVYELRRGQTTKIRFDRKDMILV